MKLLTKTREILRKDTGNMNESTKLRYVIRIMLALAVIYNLIGTLGNTLIFNGHGVEYYAVFFFVFVCVFASSYFLKTTAFIVVYNIVVLCWIGHSVHLLGWSAGVQALIIVLLVLDFFSGYKNYFIKVLYAVLLMGYRLSLFYYSKIFTPVYALNDKGEVLCQMMNACFSFLSISILCYIFSRDSQELEGKLVEYNYKLVSQANTDPLTGLNNRRKTMEYLETIMSDGRTSAVSVSICDIDFFKKVNDTYGHDIGDKVLKSIAQTMVSTLGDTCFISRWGGEEFLIVFPNMNGDNAYVMLQNLRNEISKLKFEVKERNFKVTLTYGLAEYDFHSDIQCFVKEADDKLYQGKENGRDQVVF